MLILVGAHCKKMRQEIMFCQRDHDITSVCVCGQRNGAVNFELAQLKSEISSRIGHLWRFDHDRKRDLNIWFVEICLAELIA